MQEIYRDLAAQLQDLISIGAYTFALLPGQTLDFTTSIAKATSQLTFATSWPGSTVSMRLKSPGGEIIDEHSTAPGMYHAKGATYEVYRIDSPEMGGWEIEVQGTDIPPQGEPVTLSISIGGGPVKAFLPVVAK